MCQGFSFKGKNPLHEIFEFEGFHMNFLITIKIGHLLLVVPNEKPPLPSLKYVLIGQKKPHVRGRGSEEGLRNK